MRAQPELARVTSEGRLVYDRPSAVRHRLQRLKGQRVEVLIRRPTSKRSLDQNRLLWLWVTLLADDIGYEPHERERLHYDLLAKRYGTEARESGLVLPARTSSQLTTSEMAEYLTWLQRFAAVEFGVNLPSPNEVDLSSYDEVTA